MGVANPAVPANRVPFVQKTSVSAQPIAQPNNAATMDVAAFAGIVRRVLPALISPVSAHQIALLNSVATMDAAAHVGIVRRVLPALISPVNAHQIARTRAVAATDVASLVVPALRDKNAQQSEFARIMWPRSARRKVRSEPKWTPS